MTLRFSAAVLLAALFTLSAVARAQQATDHIRIRASLLGQPEDAAKLEFAGTAGGLSSSRAPVESDTLEPQEMLLTPRALAQACEAKAVANESCRFRWRPALLQAGQFLVLQHFGNTGAYHNVFEGPYVKDWFQSVSRYRFSRWSDDDPFIVDYVGHPMMGAVTGYIQIQNDPRGAGLEIGRSRAYVKSRLRALAWSAVYAAQWELGPASETSIGNLGQEPYYSDTAHKMTNGTGAVDLVITPVAGTALIVAEDAIDRFLIRRMERRHAAWGPALAILNPTRGFANLLRFRTPWYRDSGDQRPRLRVRTSSRPAPSVSPASQ